MTTTRGVTEEEFINGRIRAKLHKDNEGIAKLAEAMHLICPEVQFIDAYAIFSKIALRGIESEPVEALHDSVKNFFIIAKLYNSEEVSQFKVGLYAEMKAQLDREQARMRANAEQEELALKKRTADTQDGRELAVLANRFITQLCDRSPRFSFNDDEQMIVDHLKDFQRIGIKYGGGVLREAWMQWDDVSQAKQVQHWIRKLAPHHVRRYLETGERIW